MSCITLCQVCDCEPEEESGPKTVREWMELRAHKYGLTFQQYMSMYNMPALLKETPDDYPDDDPDDLLICPNACHGYNNETLCHEMVDEGNCPMEGAST